MTRLSEYTQEWMGWCPNAPVLHTAPEVIVLLPETTDESRPDSGAGGSGTIGRGTGVVLSSVKTLIRNRQLLWFSFFTGLVLAGLFVAQYVIRLLSVYPYDAIDLPRWLVLTFVAELATSFCFSILLAVLVLNLSYKEGPTLSFREGLARAKKHLKPIADWSVVMALTGMLIFLAFLCFKVIFFPSMLDPVFNQFPFRFILMPEVYHIAPTGPTGGTFAIETGLTNTLLLSAINLFLFVLTLFVIPQLVLEKKRLKEAALGSAALMKNVWREVAICVLVLGIAVFAASLMSLLFRVVYGIVAPGMPFIYYPGDEWIAAALIYMAALCGLVCVGITVGGIAALDLYMYARTSRVPEIFKEKEEVAGLSA
jgi:hypothetical protein